MQTAKVKMNSTIRCAGLSVVALALVGFAAYRHVSAQQRPETAKRPEPALVLTGEPEVAATNHVLERTYVNSAAPSFFGSVPGGQPEPIDALTTVLCPGTTGTCTIVVDQNIQLYATSTTVDLLSLCFEVDGSAATCPTLVYPTPAPNTYFPVTFSQEITGVSPGDHTVQSAIWTNNGIDVGYYTFTYHVYKP
jgi:hypothetical protein